MNDVVLNKIKSVTRLDSSVTRLVKFLKVHGDWFFIKIFFQMLGFFLSYF